MATQVMTMTGYDCYNNDGIDFTKVFVRTDVDPNRGSGFNTSSLVFGDSSNGSKFKGLTFPVQIEIETIQYSDGKGGFKKPVATVVKVIQQQQQTK